MPALIAFVTELIITGTVKDLVNKGGLAEMVLGWELVLRTSLENIPIRCIGESCVNIVSDTRIKGEFDRVAGSVFLLFQRSLRTRCGQDQRKAA